MSVLLIPGPQQIERGAFPIVPAATVELVKRLGSKTYPETGWQGVPVPESGPVNAAQTVLRGLTVLNGAVRLGSPGATKSNVVSSCSTSSWEVMRIGNPLWNVRMPDTSQPSSSLPLKPLYF